MRSRQLVPKLFPPGGRGTSQRLVIFRARPMRAHTPKARAVFSVSPLLFSAGFLPLPRRLSVVALLTQTLVIVWVNKQLPVTPKGLHMVNHRCSCANTTLGALPAKWFTEKLGWPQALCPDGQTVPAVVLRAQPSGVAALGSVHLTPSIAGQFLTPRMSTGPRRFARHNLSPPESNKKAARWRLHWHEKSAPRHVDGLAAIHAALVRSMVILAFLSCLVNKIFRPAFWAHHHRLGSDHRLPPVASNKQSVFPYPQQPSTSAAMYLFQVYPPQPVPKPYTFTRQNPGGPLPPTLCPTCGVSFVPQHRSLGSII